MTDRCANCVCFKLGSNLTTPPRPHFCRRYPPLMLFAGVGPTGPVWTVTFPQTQPEGWCYEHKRKEEKTNGQVDI